LGKIWNGRKKERIFEDNTYKLISVAISKNRGLRIEKWESIGNIYPFYFLNHALLSVEKNACHSD
jgi:hypothetical protein